MAFRAEHRPASHGPVCTVEELRGRDAFLALRGEWNALAAASPHALFMRHEFLRLWTGAFARELPLRMLLARDSGGGLVGALPLLEREGRMYGVAVRELVSPTNEHSGRFDVLAANTDAVIALADHLRALPDWDVLRLSDVPDDSAASTMMERLQDAGLPTGIAQGPSAPYLPLPASPAAFRANLSSNLRSSLRRRRRRLRELGEVELERVPPKSPDLPRKLREAWELEAKGWKGRAGTAILQDERTLEFYSGLALMAADYGELALSFLRCAGRAVAFDLGVITGGRYLSFKHGYDEEVRSCSPGQLLTEELIEGCIQRQLSEFDFMGDDAPCKRDWTSTVRAHRFHFAFSRSVRGALLRSLKFRMTPLVKQWAGRLAVRAGGAR